MSGRRTARDAGGLFDTGRITELLTELGERLHAQGIEARIFVVGGAAMALAYDRERLTRDIDAVFEPKTVVYEQAKRMASDHPDLTDDWLNDAVKGFLPDLVAPRVATETFAAPGVSVGVASPEYMFAMKASAARSEADRDDLRALVDVLGITTVEQAFDVLERHYDRERLTPKTQFVLEELVTEAIADRTA